MDVTDRPILDLMRLTATDPAAGARRVLALDLPPGAPWQAFALVVILSVLLTEIAALILPVADPMLMMVGANPFTAALIQAGLLYLMVHAVHRIGRGFGGTGDLAGSLRVVVWLQAMLAALQALQIVVMLLLPSVAGLVGLAVLVYFFWMLSSFLMVLHGFQSRAKVILGIVLSFVAIVFALSFVLSLLGIVVVPEAAS